MLFQICPQPLQQTDVSGTGVLSPASVSTSGQAPVSNRSSETGCLPAGTTMTLHTSAGGRLTGSVFVKQSCPLGQAQLLPRTGLLTRLCLASSQGWGQAPRLHLHRVPEPGLWMSTDHLRPSPAPMGGHGHSTTLPPRTKDLLHLQGCPVFNFFLILLARRDMLHFQPDSPSHPLLPNHCVNHGPSW